METEAEVPEPIPSNKIGATDKEFICNESESCTALQKVKIGPGLPAKTVENFTKTEHLEVDTNVNNDIISHVIKGDVGTCEGESFVVSHAVAKVPMENTCRASENTVVDEEMILQQEILGNEMQLQKDPIQEAIEKKHDITVAENLNAFVKQGSAETGLENDGELPPSIDEGKETQKKKENLGQEVEIMDKQAPNKELPYNVEEVKAPNHSQEDEIDGKKSTEEPELELGEQVHETSRVTIDQNQEALPFTPDPNGENLKTDVTDIINTCIKDASMDDASTEQNVEESGTEGAALKGQEKSSITGVMETGPTIVNPSENIGEKKQGEENSEDNNTNSVPKAEEDSKVQNGKENINNSEGANEMFHIPPTKFMTEDTSLDRSEQKSGSIEQPSKETVDSNEMSNGEYPGENENRDADADIPLDTEETISVKSEQEAGKNEEITSSELEEKSQETIDSDEKVKDEKPLEFELQDTEDLESPLVTLATEGSHFQEQDEPKKIEENPETKLEASSVKDEEGLQRESEKLVFPLTNAPIKETDDKRGSHVIETRDNIEVTEIIEAEENSGWELQKDMEASVQSLQTGEPEEEKLEKSMDVVSEAVEPAASNVEAQRSTSEKEEESIKTIEGNFNEESKEGNINWDDEARGHRKQKDENPSAVDQCQKIETTDVESPNTEMGSLHVPHSLAEEEECEQQQEVSNLEVEEQVNEENRNAPVEDNHMEKEFTARKKMESTILEQGKTRYGIQTLELISQVKGMEVEETVKVWELDSKEKSPETDASQKIEKQTKKNEETSEIVLGIKVTEGEVEKMIIEEDSCIPDQGSVFFGNQTDDQNSEVEEKKEAPEYNGEEQNCQTNDADEATKNEIINKEVSAEPKIAGVGKDTEQQIIEESTDMVRSTESMKEPLKENSQEGEILKKHEREAHKGTDTEYEVLEKSNTAENMERQKVAENSALEDQFAPSIREETIIESCQEDKVCEGLEETDVGGEAEIAIFKEYGAVTEPCILSVVGATVKEISEEDGKEAEEFKEEDKFTVSELGTIKNTEDTYKHADASGITEAIREETLQKEHGQKFAVNEEQSKRKDLEDAANNYESFETASARTLQEAEQEGQQLVEDSNHTTEEEKSPITTETTWKSLQCVDVKGVKLGETPNPSDHETQQKKEIQDQEAETMEKQASNKEIVHNVEQGKALNHSQEDEIEGKKLSEEPELEPGDHVHETTRATTNQNQEALPSTPDLIGDNFNIDVTDIVQDGINDASTDSAPTKQDVEESNIEGVTLKGQQKSSITEDMETGPTVVIPSEKKPEAKEHPEDNNTHSVSMAEENSKIQNDEQIINNSEGTNETFHIPQTASMTEDTSLDNLEQESRNIEQSSKETVDSNEMLTGENPDENKSPDDDVEFPVVTEETRSDKSEHEARKLEETSLSELEEESQETIDSNEKMKDEHPGEYELPDNEEVKNPLVTLATEGSHFQEQNEPEKIEEASEIESENIGKDKCSESKPQDIVVKTAESTISEKATDGEDPEKNLDASTNKDEECPQRESEKLSLTNASIEENNDKKGSYVIEMRDNIEATEIIEAKENSRWEIPKDVETSEQSWQKDETEEEKLEKSLDVVSETVETDFSNSEAERSTNGKEEESNNRVEKNFIDESKEGNTNWEDEAREHGMRNDENLKGMEVEEIVRVCELDSKEKPTETKASQKREEQTKKNEETSELIMGETGEVEKVIRDEDSCIPDQRTVFLGNQTDQNSELAENSALEDQFAPSIREETIIESCQEEKVSEGLEETDVGGETEIAIFKEYGAVTEPCILSVVGATVKEISEEDGKEAEKFKKEDKFTVSELGTIKNTEDTNKHADASGITEATREEMLQKEHGQKFAVYEEQSKRKDLEDAANNYERFETASARTLQEAEQEGQQLVEDSNHTTEEEKSPITTETTWTSLQRVDVKGVKLGETPNPSDHETQQKKEIPHQEVETMDKQASNKEIVHNVQQVKALNHSQEDEIAGKKLSEEPELEPGDHVHETTRATTNQNQEALPSTPDLIGDNFNIDVTDIVQDGINDASTDSAPTKQDVEESNIEGVTLKGQQKSSITEDMETGPTVVIPSEKKPEAKEHPEDNNTHSVSMAEENSKIQNDEQIINNSEGTNETFHIPQTASMTEDTSLDNLEQESRNIEQSSKETVVSNEMLTGENPDENKSPDDDVEFPVVTEETRSDKSEHEARKLEETSLSELEEESQETIDSNEKMKDEHPGEYELPDNEEVKNPLVTLATEGSHFQEQNEPEKIEEASEIESENIGKDKCRESEPQDIVVKTAESTISEKATDGEDPEKNLDASTNKDEECPQRESEKLSLTNASIEENNDKKGSYVIEMRDNIEATEIIEAKENSRWEIPKDVETSEQSWQTDETEEEKLEKSLDVVSETVETDFSNSEAERSTNGKEEESNNRVEKNFIDESKEGNTNWEDEAREHGMRNDENLKGMEVEEIVRVCELDSKEKPTETKASQKREEQTKKNEETSELIMGETGEVEKVIREEDSCIPDQRTVFLGNHTDQNSEVAEKKEAPEYNGEEQDCKTNDTEKAARNEIINTEVSAEPKKAGVGEDTEKHIIEESTDMTHSTESMKEPLKESSQEDEFMKKDEDKVHVGPDTECEAIGKIGTGENAEKQKVVENSTTPSIEEEIVIASCQKDEVSERLEATSIGGETERAILEDNSASTDTRGLSVVGATVTESSEEDGKEAEKLKEEDEFTDFEVETKKNTEDTNKNADAYGHTVASREEILHKEDSHKFAVYEEQIKENDLEEAENNYDRYEAEPTIMSQEAGQEGEQLVDGSNLASEEKSPITTETSWTSLQHADVKEVKLEDIPNSSDYEIQQKKEILHQEVEAVDKQAPKKELMHNVEQVKALYHSQEDEIEGKKSIEEPELELGEQVHETSRATTDQNQEALPFTPESIGENLKRDVIDNIDTCIKDASTDNTSMNQDVKESSIEGVTLKGEEKSPITGVAETDPTIVNPSENAGEKKLEGEENPEGNNSDCVSKAKEGSKSQNHEENINNSEGTNGTFCTPPTKYMTEDTSSDKSEQKSGNIEQTSEETVDSNDMLNDEYPGDEVEIPLVTEDTRSYKSEQEAGKLEEETSGSELEEKSQETIDSNENMKDEKPVEYELPDTEDLESPLVTLATEGSHFQEKDEPDKIEEASEIESENIGKDKRSKAEHQDIVLETAESTISEKATDDENPEKILDVSTNKDEECPQRESEKLVLPLPYVSIKENDDKKGSTVIETRDHIEVTEMTDKISIWAIPKDVEASEQSLQTDEAEEENLEKSLDVVSKAVEPAVSHPQAERSISKKEEEPIKRVVEDSNEERKEGTINWDDEARDQRVQKDEVSAEPKIVGVGEDTEKHIIEESTDMAHSTESMKEQVKETSQEGEFIKKNEEEVHKGPNTECEVPDKSSTGENTERHEVAENSTVNDHPARSIQEETDIESCQEDEVSERLEATGVGAETVQTTLEEYGTVTDTCILSKVDAKEAEKLKKDIKFSDFEVGTLKNTEDTNKNADASGHTVASREEIQHEEDIQKFAVYEEQIKEKELEEVENNYESFEVASGRISQEAEQEGDQLVDGFNLDSEKSPITTEKSSTSLQLVDVKSVKLEETPNPSHNAENMLKVEKGYAVEGNEEIVCEMKAESNYTITFQYEDIETTTGQEITNIEAPLDNRWEETLQGSSTLTSKGQEHDSIEESKEIKDESSMPEKNLETPSLAKSTGEISIQEEEPWKYEDVSKMDTDKIGKESLNEEPNENDSAKENNLPESDPEKNTADSKDANEICKEEATKLIQLGENSRTETLKDEGKLQEISEEGELDGEKPFDAVPKDVETNSSCANIEKDVLAQEDHIKNLDEIPEGGSIGSEKVENVGIKLEAGDQSHERNEGFDPTENRALQESIEDVDPSQKLEKAHETVAKHQSHETLPGAKENKIKEDNRGALDYNTESIEYQMAMQRLQGKEKDSMNLEDMGHKDKAEPQIGEKDMPNETTETTIFNEMARNGHDKAGTSQNISKWSIEEESTGKGVHTVSIEDGRVNEVQDSAILSIEKCTKEIDNEVKTETLNIETVEFLNKRPDSPEASPITVPEDIMGISKSVPEVSEEMIKEDIFKEAIKSNNQLSIASITAIQVSSQESEAGGGNLVRESNIGSEEKFQGTVETGSMDEEVKDVKLDQNSDSRIQLPSEGENVNKEIQKLEKIRASEIEEEMKSSSDAVAESEYQAVKAITEAETTANQPPLVEESEEMPEENTTLGEKNSNGLLIPEETEDVCLQKEERMDLEQTSKMGFQDVKKASPNEQKEKDEKPDEAPNLDSMTLASAEKDDDSFQERERNTILNEASYFGTTEISNEEENKNSVPRKEESEGRKIEIPFNEVSGEHYADGQKVNTEKDLEKDDPVKTTEETLEEKAEIPHFTSDQQETESASSIDMIDTGKIRDEADKDLDASPTPTSPAEEVTEQEAVNHPEEVTQLVPEELIHAINETNEENREGAAEDKNVVKEPILVQKPNNTSTNLVPNPGGIMEDLNPTDQEVPTNESNAPTLIEASQEQAPEKASQMTENDEEHSLEFGKKPTGEVNLPRGTMEGDPANDEVAVKEISKKECEKINDYRCVQETNANEGGETSIPEQENMVAFSSVEQATAERSFRDNPNKHDTRTNAVIEDQNPYPQFAGEETVKNIHQEDDVEGKKVDKIATKLEVEDKSQASGATEDQEEEINAENENPNFENSNEDVSGGLEKADASTTIEKQTMEETQMVKDPCLASIGEETYKESQHKVEEEGNKANDKNVKVDLEDQSRGLDDEEDLKDKANEVSNGFEDVGSSERMEKQIIDEEAMNDLRLAPFKEETVREYNEEGKKDGQEFEKEVTKLDPRDQNHKISCNDDATENNIINEEVKSSDVILVEQQLATIPYTNEAEAMTIKDEANKDLHTSPTPNSPAEEALEEEIVNEPKEITHLVPELIHGINETNEDNKGAAEDKNVVKQLNKVQNPIDTSLNLVSNLGNIMEDLNSKNHEIQISNSASSPTENLHDHVLEKEGHVMEDEERNSLMMVKHEKSEVNLPGEETEGDAIKDEVQAEEIIHEEGDKMKEYNNVQKTTSGSEGGETPVQEHKDIVAFSTVELETREQSIKDSPKDHDTTSTLVIEEQSLVKRSYEECVGEETTNKIHQDQREEKKVDELATELEAKDKCQALGNMEDQMQKITDMNYHPKCKISNEEVPEELEKAVTTENIKKQKMVENITAKDPCLASIGGDTCKENHQEDRHEEKMVNDVEIKWHIEYHSQEESAGEDLGDKAKETNKTTNCQTLNDEVSLGTENAGSSEKIDEQITEDEAIKESFQAAIGEETTKKAHQEAEMDGPEIETEATNLDPKDQNNKISSQNDDAENHILNEEVKSSHLVPVEHDLETTDEKMDIMTMKEDTDVSSTPYTPAEEAPEAEAVNEPQEVPHHEPKELIDESIITNEENTESTTKAKIGAEFIEVEKLKTISSDLVSNATNIGEDLHLKDQEVKSSRLVPVVHDLETTASSSTNEKMDIMTMKEDTDVSSTPYTPAEEAPEAEAVNEPREVPHHEPRELIDESIITNEENTESTTKAKMGAEEFIEVEKLKTISLDMISNASNIGEDLHLKDQEVKSSRLVPVEHDLETTASSSTDEKMDIMTMKEDTDVSSTPYTPAEEAPEAEAVNESQEGPHHEPRELIDESIITNEENTESTTKAKIGAEEFIEVEKLNTISSDLVSNASNIEEDLHLKDQEVKSSRDLETTSSSSTEEKMDIMTMKEDTDVSSTPYTPAEEAPEAEAVNEPQEVPHHEPRELIDESIITNEENTESTTKAKIGAEEFIEVEKLNTISSDLVSNASNIGEDLHLKDQEVPTNKFNASSLNEVSQAKSPEREVYTTEDEERNSWVWIKHETGEISPATGEMEVYPINNEAPEQEILNKEAKMNETDANIANGGRETPIPEHQQRATFSPSEQAIAESSIKDSPEVPDTTANLVYDKQSQVKISLMHEVQIHQNEKTKGTNLEDTDSLNEKLSLLSDAQPSNKELPLKADAVMLPEVNVISQNIEKLEKAPDATTERSTQERISTGQKDIPSVPEDLIGKSLEEDGAEDQRHGEELETESKEKGVEYEGDSVMEDVTEEPNLFDTDKVSLCALLESTKETLHMVAGNTEPTPPANEGELQCKEQQIIHDEKEEIMEEEIHRVQEEEENYHKEMHSGSSPPVLLKVPRNADVKPTQKKSHKILSGVGSKVKHSIARIKKAIACTYPPPEATITEIR